MTAVLLEATNGYPVPIDDSALLVLIKLPVYIYDSCEVATAFFQFNQHFLKLNGIASLDDLYCSLCSL